MADIALPITHLDSIMGILGTSKASLWPGVEAVGTLVAGISSGDLTPAETSGTAEALEDDFSPMLHPGGVYSYHFNPTGDHHFAGVDHADYTHGNGTVDTAFSVGALILPNAIASNGIITKFDSAGGAEEYRFWIDADGKLSLELHDASASASEVATGDTTLTLHRPVFVVAVYDGDEVTPDVRLYINGETDNDGATTETGSYVAMEDTASPLLVGCSGVTATPLLEFHGRIAMPFMTGKQLAAAEVKELWNIYRFMVGLP